VGYSAIADNTGVFIRLAVVVSEICEIHRNSPKNQTYSSSRSSKVIDLGVNRNRICNLVSPRQMILVQGINKGGSYKARTKT